MDPETRQLESSLSGRYRLEREIGRGGMAMVYVAQDLKHDRRVAIKVLSPEVVSSMGRDRFLREIATAARLNHPHIVPLFDSGETERSVFYVMPLVEGESLRARLARGPLPWGEALRITHEICGALDHAHRRGLVHRDVKPDNVLLADGVALLADFGIVRALEQPGADTGAMPTRTAAGMIVGTPAYMAPEQIAGSAALDARADLYSLGCMLYEMISGSPPFTAPDVWSLLGHHARSPVPLLETRAPSVPPPVARVIERALAKNPDDRYPGVLAFSEALMLAAESGATRGSHAATRLPSPRTSFVGRAEELARCARELEAARLVTLTGVGGCGKTRLALEVALRTREGYPEGSWWVDLTAVSEASRVDEAVAGALGVLNAQRSPRESVIAFVRDRRLLFVLDNCEHLVEASADLVDSLMAACPELRILVTSREGLGVEGERILAVRSLSLPSGEQAVRAEAVAAADAVRLFTERAAAVQPGFAVTEANAAAVLEICRRLDGIPLAIELAAAQARLLSIPQIRDRLGDRLAALTGRGKALPRHQTLRAALRWSYDLLGPEEQRMLRLLSVFRGGWTLSAAHAVSGEASESSETLDVLWRLIEKSLVEVVTTEGAEARYRQLEMVRQFSFDALAAASEAPGAQGRHADYYLSLFESQIPRLIGPSEAQAADALEQELDNLLAAMEWSTQRPEDAERAMRAASDGWLIWVARGHIAPARAIMNALLGLGPEADSVARARGRMLTSMLARFAGDAENALADAEGSIAMHERLGSDPAGLAFALFQRGTARMMRPGGDREPIREDLARGVAIGRRVGEPMIGSICINLLGVIAVEAGDPVSAEARFREAVAMTRELGSPYLNILYGMNLSEALVRQGRVAEAIQELVGSIRLVQSSRNRHFGPSCMLTAVVIVAGRGDPATATRLLGAAVGILAEIGEIAEESGLDLVAQTLGPLGWAPGNVEYDRGHAEGMRLGFDAAMAETIRALEDHGSTGPKPNA